MTVEELNNTREGREMFHAILELQDQINAICDDVRSKTEPIAYGAYVEWDDSGFVESTDI